MSSFEFEAIPDTIRDILSERGETAPELSPSTPISRCGLDSLDIAVLVVRLEQKTGTDPFKKALERYPTTLGEMAALYARVAH